MSGVTEAELTDRELFHNFRVVNREVAERGQAAVWLHHCDGYMMKVEVTQEGRVTECEMYGGEEGLRLALRHAHRFPASERMRLEEGLRAGVDADAVLQGLYGARLEGLQRLAERRLAEGRVERTYTRMVPWGVLRLELTPQRLLHHASLLEGEAALRILWAERKRLARPKR